MADAFSQYDAMSLLVGKYIIFLGDSNTRAQYKDVVWLLSSNALISNEALRRKLEYSYLGDNLIEKSKLDRGRDFKEVRRMNFSETNTIVEFMFISRCYNRQIEELFDNIRMTNASVPDIIVMNSCIWDISRWGPNGVPEYKENMVKLMRLIKKSVPSDCLVIWTTALPVGPHVRGGLLLKQVQCMEPIMRFEVMEANMFAREVVVNHGFDVLDYHYHLRMQMHRRAKDGVHYLPIAVRLMTNLLLTHIALSWDSHLPHNISSTYLDKAIAEASTPLPVSLVTIPNTGIFSKINLKSPVSSKSTGIKITFNPDEEKTSRKCKLASESLLDCNFQEEKESHINFKRNLDCFKQTLDFQEQPTQGPYRRRNKNKRKRRRNEPYYYQRYM